VHTNFLSYDYIYNICGKLEKVETVGSTSPDIGRDVNGQYVHRLFLSYE